MARSRGGAARARSGAAPADRTPAIELPEEIAWQTWPARRRPLAALVLVAAAVVLGVLVHQGTGDRLLGLAAPLFVLLSVSSFLLPTGYRLTPNGIEVRSLGVVRVRPWSEMRRFEAGEAGLFLSPFERRSWLDAYRGLRLDPGEHRAQVVAYVQARLRAVRRG